VSALIKCGENLKKEGIRIKHKDLQRISVNSTYTSECPICKVGVLLMRRNKETFKLEQEDICVFCGQCFIYIDIDEVRKENTNEV